MRVRCRDGNYVVAIRYAKLDGKQLIFKTLDDVCCHTDDYYHENIALGALCDLTNNGYIIVDKLYIKEDF